MQLNICEGEGGRAASAGRRPCHSCAPPAGQRGPSRLPGASLPVHWGLFLHICLQAHLEGGSEGQRSERKSIKDL